MFEMQVKKEGIRTMWRKMLMYVNRIKGGVTFRRPQSIWNRMTNDKQMFKHHIHSRRVEDFAPMISQYGPALMAFVGSKS